MGFWYVIMKNWFCDVYVSLVILIFMWMWLWKVKVMFFVLVDEVDFFMKLFRLVVIGWVVVVFVFVDYFEFCDVDWYVVWDVLWVCGCY